MPRTPSLSPFGPLFDDQPHLPFTDPLPEDSSTAESVNTCSTVDDSDVRYVVAMGPELLRRLRWHAARHDTQMRLVARDAVTGLLDALGTGHPVPRLDTRWQVPSHQRSRLAVRWPAPLPHRLRAAATRLGLPAHEIVAIALVPVVAPPRARRTPPC